MDKFKDAGLFGVNADEGDFNSIKFFDVTDGFDPEMMMILNMKITAVKEKFQTW